MAQVINTNIQSLTAQRALGGTQGSVSSALERLGSGLRINSAKDDAAGLAISERFTAQIRGLNQAVRNANDGISLAQTAEGDLGTIGNNLQRIRELAVQSANATNSASDHAGLQNEVSELIAEIDRVATQSNFNGVSLLDGNFTNQDFQVGANQGQTITVTGFASARTSALGQLELAEQVGTEVAASLGASDLTINGTAVAAVTDPGASGSSAQAIADAIEAADADVSVTVGASTVETSTFTEIAGATAGGSSVVTISVDGIELLSETVQGSAGGNTITAAEVTAAVVANEAALLAEGVTFTGTASGGDLTFTRADGGNLDLVIDVGAGDNVEGGFDEALTSGGDVSVQGRGTLTLSSTDEIVIGGTTPGNAGLTAGTEAVDGLTGTTIASTDISTVQGANDAIVSVDNALTAINTSRANLGAIQNRFESVVSSLQTSSENLSAARSRIRDADFAAETAALARAQVLQQAGITVLAQANAQPQNVLALLQ